MFSSKDLFLCPMLFGNKASEDRLNVLHSLFQQFLFDLFWTDFAAVETRNNAVASGYLAYIFTVCHKSLS